MSVRRRARSAAGKAARVSLPPLMRIAHRDSRGNRTFGYFERDGGERVALLRGYRNSVKPTWPANWWAVEALLELRRRLTLSSDVVELVDAIECGRTLPTSVNEVADVLVALWREHPTELLATGRRDETLGLEILEVAPHMEELERKAAAYRAAAREILAIAAGQGLSLSRLSALDAGSGSGYLAFALAGLGVGDVVGVDLDPESYAMPTERARMHRLLVGRSGGSVRLERGDVHALAFPDGAFDLVCSMTAVEHFSDLNRSVAELSRVLRPGGLMVHGVEPWFSKRGGHGLCTLDFPWGHVRLTPGEMARYLADVRPYEALSALGYYQTGFQRPPATLRESREVFARAVELVEWREIEARALDVHRALATSAVLADCRSRFPAVTPRDLLTLTYTVVGRRGK
jgi:SAM-dependent methyltransferase